MPSNLTKRQRNQRRRKARGEAKHAVLTPADLARIQDAALRQRQIPIETPPEPDAPEGGQS